MKTPFLGSYSQSRSKNLSDSQIVNLYPSSVDTKDGKDVAAFYSTPGLTLLCSCGVGPIRGTQQFQGSAPAMPILYVVSGAAIYTVTQNFTATLVGPIATSFGPVSIINNGTQIVVFDGVNGYLMPGGAPLIGAAILTAGTEYQSGDTIYLSPTDGSQTATAQIVVDTVNGSGGVTAFTVITHGLFNPRPTQFTQETTSGSGDGLVLSSPTYGVAVAILTLRLPFSGPGIASYQDGFGLVGVLGTNQFYQSNLFDLSIWDPLNFSSADAQEDNIQAIIELHEEEFIVKQTNTEVWINAGLSGFAFQRLQGVHIETGCVAPASVVKIGESLMWLTQDDQGQGGVVMVTGYEPRTVSTKSIETAFGTYPTMADAFAYSYKAGKHLFYVITFPSGNATWCYDVVEGMWHQRAAFANGLFSRHQSNCYAFFNQLNVVGDFQNGNIYNYDQNALTDNGAQRKWLRSWRALPQPVFQPVTFSSLQIDMETGIGVPDGTNPQVVLRWSDDGGYTWSNNRIQSAGQVGQTALRVKFNRLGSTRLNSGLDRIFELSSSDQFFVGLIGANLE